MVDIRMTIAEEIDRVQLEYKDESSSNKRKLLLEQSKVLLHALIELNTIEDKIINLM